MDLHAEEEAAREVVTRYYATAVVARQHAEFLHGLFEEASGSRRTVGRLASDIQAARRWLADLGRWLGVD